MKIRRKLIIYVVASFVILFATLNIILNYNLMSTAESIEQQNLDVEMRGVLNFIDSEENRLNTTISDWYAWNDTVSFVKGEYPKYPDDNISNMTLIVQRINGMAFYDVNGVLLYEKHVIDPMGGGEGASQAIFAAAQPLTAMTEDRVMFSGFLSSGNYTAIVVAAPILDSQGNGPKAGTIIWFKVIDGMYLQEIESKTRVRVQIRPIDEATLGSYTHAGNYTYYTRVTEREIEYLKLVRDVYDEEYIGIQITAMRDIRTQSQTSINYFMTIFVVVVVVFVGIIIVLIDRSLISRLISIGDQLRGVDLSKEKLGRISSPGGDEMTQLAEDVNGLLKEIEGYHASLKEKERLAAIGETSAMVGHDLRSPLQVITSTLYLLRRRLNTALATATPEERYVIEEQLDNLDKQTRYMEKIVSDLRDISREIKPMREAAGVKSLFEDSLKMVNVPENVEVKWAIPDDSPKLLVDRGLMSRVFVNLINNAVGAMPNGGILTFSAAASMDAVRLGVWDTGQGIDEELRARLFMPFESGRKGGLGLGLAICKRIVEAHGGAIDVSSEVGKGTVFTVKLPRG